eukprot:TRINITY_DN3028_c0_g1_i3.p2 TRINITY_DN3028_c0_g1~~TRINITY_DN3028_c0_g1_i3.p2  ORF type:complete len:268 (+),score=-28.50 TRINITY_DN3028_c0_g1_i3:535-1338(+)
MKYFFLLILIYKQSIWLVSILILTYYRYGSQSNTYKYQTHFLLVRGYKQSIRLVYLYYPIISLASNQTNIILVQIVQNIYFISINIQIGYTFVVGMILSNCKLGIKILFVITLFRCDIKTLQLISGKLCLSIKLYISQVVLFLFFIFIAIFNFISNKQVANIVISLSMVVQGFQSQYALWHYGMNYMIICWLDQKIRIFSLGYFQSNFFQRNVNRNFFEYIYSNTFILQMLYIYIYTCICQTYFSVTIFCSKMTKKEKYRSISQNFQ